MGFPHLGDCCLLAVVLSYFVIPVFVPDPEERPPKVDFLGAFTATVGVTAIVYYISTGIEHGWASLMTLPILVVGVALIALFLWIETHFSGTLDAASDLEGQILHHLGHPRLCIDGQVCRGGVLLQHGLPRSLPMDPIQTRVPGSFALLRPRLYSHWSDPALSPTLALDPHRVLVTMHHNVLALLHFPAFIIHIFGMVFSLLPIQITAVRDAENKDQGLVGALFTTALQLGAPFGIALLNVISLSRNESVGSESGRGGPVLMKGSDMRFMPLV